MDAVGDTVNHISDIHKYARPEDVPSKTMVVITTDGMENASRRYTKGDIKRLIEAKKESGWEFIFIGANIDAAETAADYGIAPECAVDYHADKRGTRKVYEAVGAAVKCAMRRAPLDSSWRAEADDDFANR